MAVGQWDISSVAERLRGIEAGRAEGHRDIEAAGTVRQLGLEK